MRGVIAAGFDEVHPRRMFHVRVAGDGPVV